jgi:hypothetical protein
MRIRSPPGYRRARLSALAAGGALGCEAGFGAAASSLASAARNGSSRGAWGYLSSSMRRRIAAATAASSSSGRSMVGRALSYLPYPYPCWVPKSALHCGQIDL